ncbi:MAG: peptide deformylase [bacterium]|nr:peptide deformylase [bacterium]
MAVRDILQLGNPLLRQESASVADLKSEETVAASRDLSDTLDRFQQEYGRGRGISAPQIGIPRRIIYVRMPDGRLDGPLINPEIVWGNDQRLELWDDSMSFPDLMVRVLRVGRVRVRYLDQRGESREVEAEGDLSELLQHEIDHLDGILAVQRAVGPDAFAARAEWERRFSNSR